MAERMVRAGARDLDPSSPWHHVLWNALGADEAEAQPEILDIELEEHDQVLLCSDGLTHHVDDGLLREYLAADMPVEDSADRLIAAANQAGGSDNITVIVARFQPATQAVRPLPATHRAA
jgi:protein phosphatase